ncbi:MAG: OstA family protein [Sphingomonas fennica]
MIRPDAAILLTMLLAAAPAAAQEATSALRNHNGNAPVDVSADRIELQDRADRAVFSGNVRVVQAEMTIEAARMTVAYSSAAGGDRQVQRIDAAGNVVVTSPTETARGNSGIYDLNRRLVTLIGNVRLTRGPNSVNGGRLVIDLTTGRSTVDGNRVGAEAGAAGGGGRVTGRFTVPQRDR